jgi:DNA modification methylase
MSMTRKPVIEILNNDALDLPLDDESVDLVVTSPPYFSMRKYQDSGGTYDGQVGIEDNVEGYLKALWVAAGEIYRVLKPGGSFFFNIMDKYNSPASNQNGLGATLQGGSHEANRIGRGTTVDDVPVKSLIGIPWKFALGMIDGNAGEQWLLRSDMIWNKTNGMPDPTNDRAQRKHEYVFHFTKNANYYSNPSSVKDITSVMSLPTRGLRVPARFAEVKHPAPFPVSLPLILIDGWSPKQGVVLDPFGGSGTTALAASVLGRDGISVDLSEDYCSLALWRVEDINERSSATQAAMDLRIAVANC